MAAKKNKTRFASTEPDSTSEPRWTRTRLIWVGVAILATAGSVVFGMVAMEESDFRKAKRAFEANNYRIAKIELEHFLQENPDHAEGNVLYARTLVQLNTRPEVALQIFEKFKAATPDETHAWARANFILERWSAGVPLVEQVVNAQPQNSEALRELVAALLRLRQYERARKPAEQYLAQGDNAAMAHLFLGTINHAVDDAKKAEEHLAKVLELSPSGENLQVSPADFFAFYAQVLLNNGKAEDANRYAEQSVSYERNTQAFLVLGQARQQMGDSNNSKAAYQECIDMDNNNVEARTHMAEAYLTDGEAALALRWIEPIYNGPDLNAEIAYLVERCYRKLDNKPMVKEWASRRADLQVREEKLAKLQHWAIEYPVSFEAMMYRVWQFADEGNWIEAQAILNSLEGRPDRYDSEFGQQLVAAVFDEKAESVPSIFDFEFRAVEPSDGSAPGSGSAEEATTGSEEDN